jgi:hypothetical protein
MTSSRSNPSSSASGVGTDRNSLIDVSLRSGSGPSADV